MCSARPRRHPFTTNPLARACASQRIRRRTGRDRGEYASLPQRLVDRLRPTSAAVDETASTTS